MSRTDRAAELIASTLRTRRGWPAKTAEEHAHLIAQVLHDAGLIVGTPEKEA